MEIFPLSLQDGFLSVIFVLVLCVHLSWSLLQRMPCLVSGPLPEQIIFLLTFSGTIPWNKSLLFFPKIQSATAFPHLKGMLDILQLVQFRDQLGGYCCRDCRMCHFDMALCSIWFWLVAVPFEPRWKC